MAGNCRGTAARTAVRLDPDACNALVQSPAGLFVPRTAVQGIAPGTAVGTDRSVDVDIQAPADGDCPAAWQVGARLTPAWGQVSGQMSLNGAFGAWGPIPGTVHTLPETGVYELAADVQGGAIFPSAVNNFTIQARIFNVTAGAVVPLTARTMFLVSFTETGITHTMHATATCAAITQAAAGTQFWVEAMKTIDAGTSVGEVAFALNFRFKKVAD